MFWYPSPVGDRFIMSWIVDSNTNARPNGTCLRRFFYGLVVFLLILIVIIFVITWPTSGYRVVIEQEIESSGDGKEVESLAHRSFARAKEVTELRRFLTFKVNAQTDQPATPGVEIGSSVRPGDLLDSDLRFKMGKQYKVFDIGVTATISLDALLDAVQRFIASTILDQVPYVFAVYEYKKKHEPPVERKVQLLAHLRPSDPSPSEFPKSGQWLTRDQLVNVVAWYLFDIFEGTKANCRQDLCAKDLSRSINSLKATRSAYKIILGFKQLTSEQLTKCKPNGAHWCMLENAEQKFLQALEEDPSNAHAHLGIGLIELQRTHNAAKADLSAYTIGRHFLRSIDSMERARASSEYIREMIESEAWKNIFKGGIDWQHLQITSQFLEKARNYRQARQAMIRTEYTDVIRLTQLMLEAGPPEWLVSHLRLLKYYAELRAATDREAALEVLSLLKDVRSTVAQKDWAPIYGIGAAQWSQGDERLIAESRKALNKSVEFAKERSQSLEAEIHQVRGLVMLGDMRDARRKLEVILKTISTFKKENKKLNEGGIGIGLAMAFTALGEFQHAANWLDRAVKADVIYVETVRLSPYFSAFRDWERYRSWLLRVLPESRAPSDIM